jgi:hypothetical protein
MEIDIDSFSDFLDIKDSQGVYLGDLFYLRVREAIENGKKIASIHSKFENRGMFVCSLDREYFDVFLKAYLRWCENMEKYEICSDVNKLIESKLK